MTKTAADLGLLDGIVLGPSMAPDTRVEAIAVDSRTAAPGTLFAAVKGVNADGIRFAKSAIERGAIGVLTSLDSALRAREELGEWPVPFFIDPEPRRRLAHLAAAFFDAQPEVMVGVTGTNGKTSVASFVGQIWRALGRRGASFGTSGVEGYEGAVAHTTPEPIALHALLAELANAGVTHCAMEASSHGLAQHRVDGVRFKATAFTNLSRDHLDYHPDAADYAAAKLRLFSEVAPADCAAVINADDETARIAGSIAHARGRRVIEFGSGANADGVRLIAQDADLSGQSLRIEWRGQSRLVRLSLVGRFQGANALAAAGLVIASGEDAQSVFEALESLRSVRGRMELVARRANGAGVFVDYSHTPESLAVALAALRPHTPGRLHVVFGAGGDRDPGKRSMMGAAAAQGADRAVVTDDNPRTEDPAAIRRAVLSGAPDAEEVGDRAEAILNGVDALAPGDCLLIAGKGHETGQEVMGVNHPFDDAEQARAAVLALDGETGEIFGV
ncbi:MAG: UDP-N-acetylmuramoyl-L-alanyl-D-glutamate--2,6-diaminopimelate ligase [Pseudomonadota bacterium]